MFITANPIVMYKSDYNKVYRVPYTYDRAGETFFGEEAVIATVSSKRRYSYCSVSHDFCFGPSRIEITNESKNAAGMVISEYYEENKHRMSKDHYKRCVAKHSRVGSDLYEHYFECLKGDEEGVIFNILMLLRFCNASGREFKPLIPC